MTTTKVRTQEIVEAPSRLRSFPVSVRSSASGPARSVRRMLPISWAGVGSFCLTWLIYERLTPLSGGLGFFVTWYALFLVTVWFLARERVGSLHARDRLASVVVATVGIGMLIPLGLIVGYTIAAATTRCGPSSSRRIRAASGRSVPRPRAAARRASSDRSRWSASRRCWRSRSVSPTAVFLSEFRNSFAARPVRMIVDAMSAIPSIVAGLFIYAAFILAFHQQQTGIAAALALAVLMLPTVTRTSEVVLRLVPGGFAKRRSRSAAEIGRRCAASRFRLHARDC